MSYQVMLLSEYLNTKGRKSAVELADKLGVPAAYISAWKRKGAFIDSEGSIVSSKTNGFIHYYKSEHLREDELIKNHYEKLETKQSS